MSLLPDTPPEFVRLDQAFRRAKPVLWIGDELGAHAQPALPTFQGLVAQLRRDLWPEGPAVSDPREFLSAYRAEFGAGGKLAQFVEERLRPGGRQPRPGHVHCQIARLVANNAVAAVIDTNYDMVLRRACEEAGAAFLPSSVDANVAIPADGRPRYWALRGDCDDVLGMALDDASDPWRRDPKALGPSQLEVCLRQRPIVFVGSSLQDARILDWLAGLDKREREHLHGLVAVLEESVWSDLQRRAQVDAKYGVLVTWVRPALLPSSNHLSEWLEALADRHAGRDAHGGDAELRLIDSDDELPDSQGALDLDRREIEIIDTLERYIQNLLLIDPLRSTAKSIAKSIRSDLEKTLPQILGQYTIFRTENGLNATPARSPMTIEPRMAFYRGRKMDVHRSGSVDEPSPRYFLQIEEHPEAGADIVEEVLVIASDVDRIDPQFQKRLEALSRRAVKKGVVGGHALHFDLNERLINIADQLAERPDFYTVVFSSDSDIVAALRKHLPGLSIVLSRKDPDWVAIESKLYAKLTKFYLEYYKINPTDAAQ